MTTTVAALAAAARDARRAWDYRASMGTAVVAVAALLPLVLPKARVEDLAAGLYLALAGVVAGLAAVVAAPSGAFDVDTAALYGLKGLAAAVAVRFALWTSFAAGIAVGFLEAAVANVSWAGPSYREVVPLALVLALLAARGLREPEARAE